MSSQLSSIRAQLDSIADTEINDVLEAIDVLHRASYASLPLHPVSLPITKESLSQLVNDLNFQMRWAILFADKQEELSNNDRENLGDVKPPFTPESVALYMEQFKRVEEERTLWSSLSFTRALPQSVTRRRLFCQQIQDVKQPISCGEDDLHHQMQYVSTGLFQMGASHEDPEAFDLEKPRHTVVITVPFWIDRTPVTQALYKAVMNNNPVATISQPVQ